jgi:hypothetical protein
MPTDNSDSHAPASHDAQGAAASGRKSRVEALGGAGCFAVFLGGAGLVVLAVVGGVALLGDRLPLLTEQSLAAAQERWDQSGVKSYMMDIEISGQRAGDVHVEVRNGVVTKLARDGRAPRERRTWDVWSVPGQFDMLERGLKIAADPAGELQAPRAAQVVVRASFHPQLGYPIAFSQVMLGGGPEFGWRIVRFEKR